MTTQKQKTVKSRATKPASKARVNGAKLDGRVVRKLRNRARHASKRERRGSGALTTTGDRPPKTASILTLVERSEGATIDDLTGATGWQAHSVRAALTGLRKKGHVIVRTKDDAGLTRYCIAREG